MNWSGKRRVITVFVVLAIFGVFVVFPYWITHREIPSCFDQKQNQNEEGVDCGGVCTLACKQGLQDLKILWTNVFPVRSGVYDVVAYVENVNIRAGAPKIVYIAELRDASGVVIASRRGETYALPTERFAIFEGGMETGGKTAVEGSITIDRGFNWVQAVGSGKLFTVENKVLSSPDRMPRLSAILHNETPETYRNIDVAVVIYDKKGVPIAVSKTVVEKLTSDIDENMFFTWNGPFSYVAESGKCDTPVDVILALDRSGSMRADNKFEQAKSAAAQFVTKLSPDDRGAYVSFATDASRPIDQVLTQELSRLAKAIGATTIHSDGLQYTNIGDAINSAVTEFDTQRHDPDSRSVLVLLTDGEPTQPKDPSGKDPDYPAKFAQRAADIAKQNGITIYSIGLGDDVKTKLLTTIASDPENYYFAATGAELADIYGKIAGAMCKKAPSVIEIIPRVNTLAQ